MTDLEVGKILEFASQDGSWVRQLKVTAVDGDRVTYEPVDDVSA